MKIKPDHSGAAGLIELNFKRSNISAHWCLLHNCHRINACQRIYVTETLLYKLVNELGLTFSSDPVLPTTQHPFSLANCPAYIPTAPAAAEMNTFDPAFTCPATTSIPTHAANPGTPATRIIHQKIILDVSTYNYIFNKNYENISILFH